MVHRQAARAGGADPASSPFCQKNSRWIHGSTMDGFPTTATAFWLRCGYIYCRCSSPCIHLLSLLRTVASACHSSPLRLTKMWQMSNRSNDRSSRLVRGGRGRASGAGEAGHVLDPSIQEVAACALLLQHGFSPRRSIHPRSSLAALSTPGCGEY